MQTEVLVVISGKLQVHAKQDDGSEILLAQIGPGETLGEISLFNPGPAAATVTALEFSQLWRIADDDLIHFMEENPGAGNVLLRTLASILAQRLRQMNPRAFGLSTYAVVDSPELPADASAVAVDPVQPAAAAPVTPVQSATAAPVTPIAPATSASSASPTPALGISESYQVKRVSKKTQIIPDPDELEPIE